MPRRIVYTEESYVQYRKPPRDYGCFMFLFDIFMTFVTGGFWLIWIFAREMRRR